VLGSVLAHHLVCRKLAVRLRTSVLKERTNLNNWLYDVINQIPRMLCFFCIYIYIYIYIHTFTEKTQHIYVYILKNTIFFIYIYTQTHTHTQKNTTFWESDLTIYSFIYIYIFLCDATAPSGPGPPHDRGFTMTLRHTTLGRTPLHERSALRKYLYLTTHHTTDRPSCPRQVSNPQSQQVSGHWDRLFSIIDGEKQRKPSIPILISF
jgi:hypothetical protein